jgi:dihydrofolate reductase
MSLDGMIAGPDDDVSWLFTDDDYGFDEFFSTIDALVMGRGTYQVVKSFGKWPYANRKTVIVSSKGDVNVDTSDTTVWQGDLADLVTDLEAKGAQRVWLVGGGELVRSFLNQQLIDELVMSLHPILLAEGVPLFPKGYPRVILSLETAESFESGLVQLTYTVEKDD